MDTPITPAEVIEADEVLRGVLGIPSETDFKFGFKVQIFNYRMRKLRNLLGITQAELGKKADTSAHTIGAIEGFRTFPSERQAQEIARVLRTSVEDLFPEWLRFYVVDKSTREFVSTSAEVHKALEIAPYAALAGFLNPSPDETNPHTQADAVIRDKVLREALKRLPPRERAILTLRFGLDGSGLRTLEEVAAIVKRSRGRVGAIEQNALGILRRDIQLRIVSLPVKEGTVSQIIKGKVLSPWDLLVTDSQTLRRKKWWLARWLDDLESEVPILCEEDLPSTLVSWFIKAARLERLSSWEFAFKELLPFLMIKDDEASQAEATLRRTITFGKP